MGKWDARFEDAQVAKVGKFPIVENTLFHELAKLDAK